MSDRKNKMTDWVSTGQSRADYQLNSNPTTDRNEKRKSPRFAFLKISATAHCTHLQSRTSQPAAQPLQKSAILPTLKKSEKVLHLTLLSQD